MSPDRPAPRGAVGATYRVQLNAGFTFDDAAAVAGYLRRLGITHLYCSPYLQAAAGSTHGYDVIDHGRLNAELGGADGHARMTRALEEQGIGQVLDIVPNHMALAGPDNGWWWDVLENGPSSQYAAYFDIDWDPPETKLMATVLVPVLGDHYGRVLEAGELQVVREGGSFVVRYYDHEMPLSPRSLDGLVSDAARRLRGAAGDVPSADAGLVDELESVALASSRLPHALATDRASQRERHRDKEVLRNRLARLAEEEPTVAAALDEAVKAVNEDHDALDALLQRQNYRLAYWRTAGRELDYRRFFDINTLVALRTEDEQVFDDTHALVLELVASGVLDGLRVDHVDGLLDPAGYLRRLRARSGHGTYLVVEKILEPGEPLPASWPVQGTSGYDFLNRVGSLFVDPAGEGPITELYHDFTGESAPYDDVVWLAKQQIMRTALAADVERVTAAAVQVCERQRRYRDYTRPELRDTLRELAAAFGVYRTYVVPGEPVAEADVAAVEAAVRGAAARRPDLDTDLLAFLGDVLLLRHGPLTTPVPPGGPDPAEALAVRFQQLTAPVMAKGVEDTAFYRFNRLVSLNEVGGDPSRFGRPVEEFHRVNRSAAAEWPQAMLATSTHDTKRSEDVRARISLLSEMPDAWGRAVRRWSARNERHRRGEGLPDRNLEYLLYQVLVGAWPLDGERAAAYLDKAAREAKVHTSWTDPVPEYDDAVQAFVAGALGDAEFVRDLERFAAPLVEAGRVTSLAQAALRLTAPGVPDTYQGTEVWDLSLVDPDNRRPVDYRSRAALLDALAGAGPAEALARADEGGPKLWLVHRLLGVRRERPAPFGAGAGYEPLRAAGPQAGHVVGFVRGGEVAVVVPRLVLGLARAGGWAGTTVALPPGHWSSALNGGAAEGGGDVLLAGLLAEFPVAVLVREGA